MSEFRLSFPACVIAGKNRLTPEDILLLRTYCVPDGIRNSDDAITLLAIHTSCPEKCAEWDTFFVETMTQFILHDTAPRGAMDDNKSAWLQRMIMTDGVIHSGLELDLLLHVIEHARSTPDWLRALTLDQLRLALASETGAYGSRRGGHTQGITDDDMDFIRRATGDKRTGNRPRLSSEETAVLQRIDRITPSGANHPDWMDLITTITGFDAATSKRWLRVADSLLLDEGDEAA